MHIYCPKCGVGYEIDEELIEDQAKKLKCSNCGEIFAVAEANWAEKTAESREFLLVAHSHAVALRVVKVVGIFVGGVGEQVEPELPFGVELDLYVEIPDHVASGIGRTAVAAVAHIASDYHPVVEQLGRDGHVEDVRSACGALVAYAHVERNVEFLQYGVELV